MGDVNLSPAPVFDLLAGKRTLLIGADTGALAETLWLGAGGDVHTVCEEDAPTIQLDRRFDVAVIMASEGDEGLRRSLTHCAVQHLARQGHLVVVHEPQESPLCSGFRGDDFHAVYQGPVGKATVSVFIRSDRTTVHDLLYDARATIRRVTAHELFSQLGSAAPPLVLDTRTQTDRGRFGVIPGCVHVPRTVVEWHLDPANGYLHPAMQSFDQPLVVVCNSGYSSSLAAANLVRIGFRHAADLVGGHAAWCAAGLPVERADHSHLDTPTT